ncbi:hypothetical protein PoB_005893200 [Plakobranchus ocellatus]|uniref:Uncharacterized protein n=1 Tax=Plakobranchus ocellatus TaxID=259542 RepID=A0AAV4CKY2_9GAST|nr:hypothetical protein PoB_005893200 [Plakobranchus ocellatus]
MAGLEPTTEGSQQISADSLATVPSTPPAGVGEWKTFELRNAPQVSRRRLGKIVLDRTKWVARQHQNDLRISGTLLG